MLKQGRGRVFSANLILLDWGVFVAIFSVPVQNGQLTGQAAGVAAWGAPQAPWWRRRKGEQKTQGAEHQVQNINVVGPEGFEPSTSSTRTRRSTKLSHGPTLND